MKFIQMLNFREDKNNDDGRRSPRHRKSSKQSDDFSLDQNSGQIVALESPNQHKMRSGTLNSITGNLISLFIVLLEK